MAKGVARDTIASNDGVAVGSLKLLLKPIAGVAEVTNPSPSMRLDRDESSSPTHPVVPGTLSLGLLASVWRRSPFAMAMASQVAMGRVRSTSKWGRIGHR